MFFKDGHWGQCLELVQHLCQHGDSILLISGPTGIGKTSLKRALIDGAQEELSFSELQVKPGLDCDEMMRQVEAAVASASSDAHSRGLVLLIDDAQSIDLSLVEMFLGLKDNLDTTKRLQIVLFARPSFARKISASAFSLKFLRNVHTIEIEALTLAESEAFLKYIWQQAGHFGDMPWDKATVRKIYAMANGVPGKVKVLATEFLEEGTINKSRDGRSRLSPLAVGLTVSAGLLCCLLAFLWPIGSVEQQANESTTQVLPLFAAQEPEQTIESIVSSEAVPVPVSVPAVAPAPEPQNFNTAVAQPGLVETQEKLVQLEEKVLDLQHKLTKERDGRRIAEAKLQEALQMIPRAGAKKLTKSQKNTSIYSKQENKLLSMPARNYTLQLLGASNEQKVKEFIKNNKLAGKAYYFKSSYQGKPWYIIVHGNYATRSEANFALQDLPASIRRLDPWPRDYASIQNTLKNR